MNQFSIYSGVPKGVNRDEYSATVNWLDALHRSFSESSYRLHEPKPPINTNYWPLWDMAQELQAIAESIKRERKTGRPHYVYQEDYGYEVEDRKRRPPEPPDPRVSCLSLFTISAVKAYYGKS